MSDPPTFVKLEEIEEQALGANVTACLLCSPWIWDTTTSCRQRQCMQRPQSSVFPHVNLQPNRLRLELEWWEFLS